MADLVSSMVVDEAVNLIRSSRRALAEQMVGAKSSIPGLTTKLKPSPAVERAARRMPVEVDDSSEEADDAERVSLHAYLRLAKGEKITPELLEKAEKKARREGNQAILDRIEKSKRFILRSKAPKTPGKTSGGRGFAVYRGIQPSPKVAGKKSLKCVCVGFGYIDYYYLPGDGRVNIESLDRKLAAMFKSNGVGAAVELNSLVRSKKLSIYLRFDRATKKEKVVTGGVNSNVTSESIFALASTASILRYRDEKPSLALIGPDGVIASLSYERTNDVIASGDVDLKQVNRSLFNYLAGCKTFYASTTASSALVDTWATQRMLDRNHASVQNADAKLVVKASLDLTALGPTKMYKEKSSNGYIRTIESKDYKISLNTIDWDIVKAVIEQKISKALVDGGGWTVTIRNQMLNFINVKNQTIKIAVDVELAFSKLS